jgi:predicted transposase YdaD
MNGWNHNNYLLEMMWLEERQQLDSLMYFQRTKSLVDEVHLIFFIKRKKRNQSSIIFLKGFLNTNILRGIFCDEER